jgi:transcriptional regulator with XRE-family HTH domain
VPPPARPDPAFAAVVRSLREHAGMSQEAVARDARLSVASYARIERGQVNPTWTTVRRIAGALGIKVSDLARAVETYRA